VPPSSRLARVARETSFGQRLLTAFVIVPIVAVVAVVLANVLVEVKLSSASRVDVQLATAPDGGGANYLLIGSDTRAFATDPNDLMQFGNASSAGGQRSDTMMVLHTDPDSDRALLVSFPRDLWVDIPGHGHAKLNAAFNYGPQTVIDTMS
jgi:anionic cell wall polymer biosynthesis LytR-Cps2A-Psr (LCP) family protein